METTYYARPSNFVAEINGNLVCRDEATEGDGKCSVWSKESGWWAFRLDEASARRHAEMYPPKFHREKAEAK
jgi:hypothetical protein